MACLQSHVLTSSAACFSGVTRALHIYRGNNAGGRWVANGGYGKEIDDET